MRFDHRSQLCLPPTPFDDDFRLKHAFEQLCTLLDDTSYRTSSLHDESHHHEMSPFNGKKNTARTHVRITMAITITDYVNNVALFVKCDTLPMECLRALTACLSSSRMHRIVPHGSMQLTTFDKSKKAMLNS
ncbi:hypothetical protein T02_9417 [Trichinella nativa]|uniref:Uncharacterized protein n=1 Tax=Trichinella nativa TaxID=6335 RepID=A0A0V1LIB2_9BILA|nr:hypothetical protein T02_9417 [Trichinella nativa]